MASRTRRGSKRKSKLKQYNLRKRRGILPFILPFLVPAAIAAGKAAAVGAIDAGGYLAVEAIANKAKNG